MPRTAFAPVLLVSTLLGLVLDTGAMWRASPLHAALLSALHISQIYGAGGNQDALWQTDFVELFNGGNTEISLLGWAIEYAPAGSANWQRTPLDALTIAPFSYLLIAGAAGTSGAGSSLPAPDIAGSTNLNASSGKVRLVDNAGSVVDLVGYGDADEHEGNSPVPQLSAAQGALRRGGGCQDTDQNGGDFVLATPAPRNSTAAGQPCPADASPTPATVEATASPTLSATVAPSEPALSEPVTVTLTAAPPTTTPTATLTALPTATPTAPPPTARTLLITEFLADPDVVDDDLGEWIELANTGAEPINLRGWVLADLGQDGHTIAGDLWVAAGSYIVLGHNDDMDQNGGVPVDYVYSGLQLANSDDEIRLLASDGGVVDEVSWGSGMALSIKSGASLYRAGLHPDAMWLTATIPWPGSNGDWGNPGTAPPVDLPTEIPAVSPTPSSTPLITTTPSPPLFISEFLADPAVVADSEGEWIEVHNPAAAAVNLRGWTLSDAGRDHHVIAADLLIAAGSYVVLARNGDPLQNGGLVTDYVYSGLQLANGDDEIRLRDPSGWTIDHVHWGAGSALIVSAGASLERTDFGPVGQWQTAIQPWTGSAGDRGSPGMPYSQPLMTPTPTALHSPTSTPTPSVMPTPSVTLTPSATPTRPTVAWISVAMPALLQIEEVHFHGSGGEYISLLNTGDESVELTGWRVGDAEIPGGGEGIYDLPAGMLLAPNEPFVIARNGAEFAAVWGTLPQAQFEQSDAPVPLLTRARELGSGTFALNDNGDEVVLINPAGQLADGVVYGNGDTAALGISGTLPPKSDLSLQRVPGFAFPTTLDLRHRFLWAPPDPFDVRSLPPAQTAAPIPLADGYAGLVGSLGVASTFSPDGIAPPHLLAWAAAAAALHFIAIADPGPEAQPDRMAAPILSLPAWRWQQTERKGAVVYGSYFAAGADPLALLDGLGANGFLAQWIGDDPPRHPAIVAHAGNSVDNAADAYTLWRQQGEHPPLLAGNALPPLPGYFDPRPRYTGLAVAEVATEGITAALRAQRGWLTSDAELALTLRSTAGVWMGSVLPVAAELSLVVTYQDTSGETAGLAIWQDGRPLRQLDLPPAGGEWRVNVPAQPGSLIYAVATQLDGDFAITAPLRVAANGNARIWINEVLPIPISDFNGDGVATTADEYVELWNAGPSAISLADWVLEDRPAGTPDSRRRYPLGPQHFLNAGDYLLIWGSESFIGLNNSNERLQLFDATGTLIDAVEWTSSPGADRTLSRVPDGGRWDIWSPSPGRSNGDPATIVPPTPTPPAWSVAGSAAPGTPGGEAVGPFGSVTAAKLAGLAESVHFAGVVIAPPGLFNSAIYVADAAADGTTAGLGIQVYLRQGDFPSLAEGDRVDVQGVMDSFRGEREVMVAQPVDLWQIAGGTPLAPLPVTIGEIGEQLEGRLVSFEGIVSGYRGSSFFLRDPQDASSKPVEIHIRSSLPWRRPFVVDGDRWQITGIVGQFAATAPWNGGYRVLVRYESDLLRTQRGEE